MLRSNFEETADMNIRVESDTSFSAFAPNAWRAMVLDQRMRLRLAESLRYILQQADGALEISEAEVRQFLSRLEQRPISPLAFSYYSDIVLAIENDEVAEAGGLFAEMLRLPSHAGGLVIQELADPRQHAISQRYARFIDTDPSLKLEIFPPSRAAAERCREQIHGALALMDAGAPELAAEIRALLREIMLGAGSEDPKAIVFDGASAFMLWGAIIINANRSDGELEMAQMLAHESAHNLLFGLSADESLVDNSPEELFKSPLRADPRPMDGIYHATYVTARMHWTVRRLLASGTLPAALHAKAQKDLETNRRLFNQGIETVQQNARLSDLGTAVMRGAIEYMKSV
jgi:hypothetical protein